MLQLLCSSSKPLVTISVLYITIYYKLQLKQRPIIFYNVYWALCISCSYIYTNGAAVTCDTPYNIHYRITITEPLYIIHNVHDVLSNLYFCVHL